jgi:hypothetical protein
VLFQVVTRAFPPDAVHDTVHAVARGAAFQRSLQSTMMERLMAWLAAWFWSLFQSVRGTGLARTAALGMAAVIVFLVLARLLLSARARDELAGASRRRTRAASGEDPWRAAERLASEQRYEEAAHALYHGVVATVAQRERLRIDPSKTSGDYARELRARGSAAYAPFRAFGRRFDAAIFGHDRCDAAVIDELLRLALPFAPRARAA